MSDQQPGDGHASRSARVLDPAFVESLEELPLDEVRARRNEAHAEREFQSYLRRLIQVRQDLLVAERHRREAGKETPPLVERITEVLAEGPKGASRGEVLRVNLPQEDTDEAELQAEERLGDFALADPVHMSDEELTEALDLMDRVERAVSANRTAVLKVHDRLQGELKRRYREDPTQALR